MPEIADLEIDGLEFKISPLSLIDSVSMAKRHEKISLFEFIGDFISHVTTLSQAQVSGMSAQSAIAVMVYHRFYFWDNFRVSESPLLSPRDFLCGDESASEEFVNINGYQFSNKITLSTAINAEKLCLLKGDHDLMCFYLLSSFCTKGIKYGLKTLISEAVDGNESRNNLTLLNNKIMGFGAVKLDLLQSTKNVSIWSECGKYMHIDEGSFFLDLVYRTA